MKCKKFAMAVFVLAAVPVMASDELGGNVAQFLDLAWKIPVTSPAVQNANHEWTLAGRASVDDVFAQCGTIDVRPIHKLELADAVSMVNACLEQTYPQEPAAPVPHNRMSYTVTASKGKVDRLFCSDAARRTSGCGRITEVNGIVITLKGNKKFAGTAAKEIKSALARRNGMLLGYYSNLNDESK